MSSRTEFDERNQYHNKVHEVVLKSGETLYGLVSRIDTDKREFYLLEPNQVGMLGSKTGGRRLAWDDCKSVRAENQRKGVFDDSMIPEWERWARQAGAK